MVGIIIFVVLALVGFWFQAFGTGALAAVFFLVIAFIHAICGAALYEMAANWKVDRGWQVFWCIIGSAFGLIAIMIAILIEKLDS